jgi:hypothetical protein
MLPKVCLRHRFWAWVSPLPSPVLHCSHYHVPQACCECHMNYNALPRGRDLRSLYVRWDPGHSPKVVLGLPVLPITLLSPGSILFSGEKRSLKDTQQEEASPLPMRGWHSIQGVSFSPTPPHPRCPCHTKLCPLHSHAGEALHYL